MAFIPYVNALILFTFYFNYFKIPKLTLEKMLKSLIMSALAATPIVLISKWVSINIINNILNIYIAPLIIGLILIHVQQKYINMK